MPQRSPLPQPWPQANGPLRGNNIITKRPCGWCIVGWTVPCQSTPAALHPGRGTLPIAHYPLPFTQAGAHHPLHCWNASQRAECKLVRTRHVCIQRGCIVRSKVHDCTVLDDCNLVALRSGNPWSKSSRHVGMQARPATHRATKQHMLAGRARTCGSSSSWCATSTTAFSASSPRMHLSKMCLEVC